MTAALYPGQRFTRPRGFGLGPFRSKWWLAAVRHGGFFYYQHQRIAVTGEGVETIEIVEIVPTQVLGTMVYYRQWVTDPDGEEVQLEWVPKQSEICGESESVLRRTLAGFTDEAPRASIMAEPKSFMVH
jgi:hypothetical protein